MSHSITKCSCGAVLAQCRCPAPDKPVIVVKDGCGKCKTAIVQAALDKAKPHE